MADAGVTLKFFGDTASAQKAVDELNARTKKLADDATARNAKAKAHTAEQINNVKAWQAANNEAMSAEVANIKRREKMVEGALQASRAAQKQEAQNAYKFDQERLAHRQAVIARMTAMENEHAAKHAAGFSSTKFKNFNNEQQHALRMQERRLALLDKEIAGYGKMTGFKIPVPSMGPLAAGVAGAATVFSGKVGQQNIAQFEDVSKSSYSMSELELKLMNQAGLSKQQARDRIATVSSVATEVPTISTIAGAVEMQTWLESADLNKEDVESGDMLRAVTEGLAGLNAFGKDKGFASDKDSVRNLVGGMKAFGMEGTAENLRRFQTTLAMGFKETAVEAYQIPQYIKASSGFAEAGISPEESFAMFSTMTSSGTPAESAGRAMENYVAKLADVKPNQERDTALQGVGLKQSDVQITKGGNTLYQSLGKMRTALAGVTEEQKQSFISQVFGVENMAEVSKMLRDQDEMKQKADKFSDGTAIHRAVANTQGHESSRRTRDKIKGEFYDWQSSLKMGVTWQDVEERQAARYKKKFSEAGTASERIGASIEHQALAIGNWFVKQLGYSPNNLIGREDAMPVIIQNVDELRQPRTKNRNGNVEFVPAVTPNF